MLRRPPSYTLTDTLFPYSTLVRSPVRPTNPVQANPARQRSPVSIYTNRSTQRLVSRNKRTNGVLQNYFCIERLVSRNATGMFYVPKTFLAAAAAPLILVSPAFGQNTEQPGRYALSGPRYADFADLVLAAPMIVDAVIVSVVRKIGRAHV